MIAGVGKGVVPNPAAQGTEVTTAGASAGGGLLANQKDAKEASTEAKFGDVWKNIQSKYGAKAEKPREIKKTLGKDDFLRIMVTQMKHQDPTSPFKAEQMATQIAQFTSVEQLQNLNQAVAKLQTANQPLERLAMTNMIGKTVTIDRERFPHTEGQNEALNYALPKDAKEVKVSVYDEKGDTIIEKDLGAQKAGENLFTWDGLKTNTLAAKTGQYLFRISAKDASGNSISTNPTGTVKVIGVSFEGSEPVFLTGNAAHPDKVLLRNVVRIDEGGVPGHESAPDLVPGAQSLAAASVRGQGQTAAEQQQPAQRPMFGFKRGEGSANIDSAAGLPPEAQAALQRYQAEMAANQAAARSQASSNPSEAAGQPGRPAASAPSRGAGANAAGAGSADLEKGFPNGLNQ